MGCSDDTFLYKASAWVSRLYRNQLSFYALGLGCRHSELPLPLPSVCLIKWAERRRFCPRSDDFQTGLRGCFYVILSENQ